MTTPAFRASSFQDHVNEVFGVSESTEGSSAPLELSLKSVTTWGPAVGEGQRQPFSIILHGPLEPVLAQRVYRFEHPAMGLFDIFIVPIGPAAGAMQYEAVFA